VNRAALKLFESAEDALEFLQDYDMDEARVKLLKGLGRVPEAAEIHAKNGDVLKAAEMLTTSTAHSLNYVRPTAEHILTGLRQDFTIGVLPSSGASKLLALADQLEKGALPKGKVDEASSSHQLDR
jgi:hypothetical protein